MRSSVKALLVVTLCVTSGTPSIASRPADDSANTLRVGATPGTITTGILDWLTADFRVLHPEITFQIVAVSSVDALDRVSQGMLDLLILHHQPTEELIVLENYGKSRVLLMYNEFVVLGPPNSDLTIGHETDIHIALRKLSEHKPSFLAPPDSSTAAIKLNKLWADAGVTPDWPGYEVVNANLGYILRTAAQFGAYTFVDMGTYLSMKQELQDRLQPQLRDLASLRNYYSIIPINAAKVAGVRQELAVQFRDYLVSGRGQARISTFGIEQHLVNSFLPAAHLDDGLRAERAEQRLRQKDRVITLLIVLTLLTVGGTTTIAVLWYRSKRLGRERDLYFHRSMYDSLTGLPARRLADDRLQIAINVARRRVRKVALLFIDLDDFKNINDIHGHAAGDTLLMQVATRLQHNIRSGDTAARIGGDEFLVILADLTQGEEAGPVAKNIIDDISRPIDLPNLTLSIGSSIGIAVYPDDATDVEALRRLSDDAMYRAKQSGKNAYLFACDTPLASSSGDAP